MELEPNILFAGRYRLIDFRGFGKYDEVWLAHDEQLDMDVALKVYFALDDRGLAEFKSEYSLIFSLNHPNLLHVTYFDQFEKRPYLVMPYCPGAATNYIGNIDEPTLWRFIRDVASGLEYLHSMGIIHHDIKPDNVLIDSKGNFLITDFGINKKIRSIFRRNLMRQVEENDVAGGSIPYMGPEMFGPNPESVNATDIWALGATLYEMCEGELPFFGQGGGMQLNGAQITKVSGNYSDDFKQIVQMCLAKEIWDRPTVKQLVTCANAIIDGKQFGRPIISEKEKNATCCPIPSSHECDCSCSSSSYSGTPRMYKRKNLLGSILESISAPIVLISDSISSAFKTLSKTKIKPNNTQNSISYQGFNAYSSIFAPAEIKKKSHLIIQVYLLIFPFFLHLFHQVLHMLLEPFLFLLLQIPILLFLNFL